MTHDSLLLSVRFLRQLSAVTPLRPTPRTSARRQLPVRLAASLRYREVLGARMGRSAKVSKFGMPAFAKNKKMSSNAAKPQSASGSAIKKAAPKKQAEKKKAQFKGDTFQGKLSKKA